MNQPERQVARYFFADLVLDVQRGRVTRGEQELPLPKLSYDLLLALLQASPTLLSQQALMEKVWPNVVIGDETLKQRVKLLRKSLGDKASKPIYIEAVRGRGYRLVPDVSCESTLAQVPSLELDLGSTDHFPNLSTGVLTGSWQQFSKISILVLVFLVLALNLITVVYPDRESQPYKARILVLPFKHSLPSEQAYLAPQLRRWIQQQISTMADVELVSPNRVDAFYAQEPDASLIAKRFSAGLVLEGSANYHQGRFHISLFLNDAERDVLLWSREFSGEIVRLDQLKSQIANAIALRLGQAEFETNSVPERYRRADELYRQGLDYYRRYRGIDNQIAIDFFQKAMTAAEDYSPPYSGLSQAYSQQVFQFDGDATSIRKAIDYAYRAIAYDSQSADAYRALGTAYYVAGWLSKAIDPYLKSLTLAPNDIQTLSNLGFIYSEQGKLSKALEWNRRALELDPNHTVSMVHASQTLWRLGLVELAEKWLQKAIERQPDYLLATYYLGQIQIAKGEVQDALARFTQALTVYSEQPLLMEGLADSHLARGQEALALNLYRQLASNLGEKQDTAQVKVMVALLSNDKSELLQTLKSNIENKLQSGSDKALYSYQLAMLFAKEQKNKRAVRYLVQSVEQGLSIVEKVEAQPIFSSLMKLPASRRLIEKMKKRQGAQSEEVIDRLEFWRE